jgi:hypothetical protein
MIPLDLSVSTSTSSAAQSGQATTGNFSGIGGGRTPWYVWAIAGVMGLVGLFVVYRIFAK